jgi:hypothetical protein
MSVRVPPPENLSRICCILVMRFAIAVLNPTLTVWVITVYG